jgi:uncharacterized protein YaiL (DUF2058 family)
MSKQKLSLQDQLLKSGLVSAAQAKTVKADKRKQEQLQRNNKVAVADDAKVLAQQAQAEKIARDRELNEQRKQQELQKERVVQVKQLLDGHSLPTDDNGVAYHFNDGNKVKTLYVGETMREQLSRGRLAIIKFDQHYHVVSAETAEKIKQRDACYLVVYNEPVNQSIATDDPYAAYAIPDDLVW